MVAYLGRYGTWKVRFKGKVVEFGETNEFGIQPFKMADQIADKIGNLFLYLGKYARWNLHMQSCRARREKWIGHPNVARQP